MRMERQVLFWLFVSVLFIVLIGMLKEILLPFVLGMVFAYVLNPVANWLERLGVSRLIASLLIVVALLVVFVVLLVFLVPVLIDQAQQLMHSAPRLMTQFKGVVTQLVVDRFPDQAPGIRSAVESVFSSFSNNWTGVAQVVAESAWTHGRTLFNVLALFLITPLVVFYLLVDWHSMLRKADSWLPRTHADKIRTLAFEVNESVAAFVRGQGMVCIILGAVYAIGLSLVGLNYGLLIGAATGLMAFVPFVGWTLGTLTGTILALIQFWPDPLPVFMVVGVFLLGQGLDAGFLSPNIVGSKIGLHPVWLIFALFAFSYLFGVVGVLVAVPLAAAVGVLVRFALTIYLDSSLYSGVEAGPDQARVAGSSATDTK